MSGFINSISRAGLLAGLVAAGGGAPAQVNFANDAVVEQLGTDNAAKIEQVGNGNRAGSDALPLIQDGIYNDLDILQQGARNRIGLLFPGLSQIGRENTQTIFNRIVIEQLSDDNSVGSVAQTSEGSIVNGANTLVIRQGGSGLNSVETVRQTQKSGQASQVATVIQTGELNRVALIEQVAVTNVENDPNSIVLDIRGLSNGRTGLSGYAAESGAPDSAIVQRSDALDGRNNGNAVDLLITGDLNRFGIRQGGRQNDVGFITVSGNSNQLGIRQSGNSNDVAIAAPIEGDDNNFGIDQLGTNLFTLTLDAGAPGPGTPRSDRNEIFVQQDGTNNTSIGLAGDDNVLRVIQDYDGALGGTNLAELAVVGHNNLGRVIQFGDNRIEIEIIGDDNNRLGFSLNAALAGVSAGNFLQEGAGNDATITVLGNANAVGTTQTGIDNALVAVVTGGLNQAAISQSGAGNLSELSQNGDGNIAWVVQN